MKKFSNILIAITIIFAVFQVSAQEVDIELKGIMMASSPKQISSPWGMLQNQMLLLNNPQKISMNGNNLSIVFGLFYFDAKSATTCNGDLNITRTWTAKTPMKVKMYYDKVSGNWCVTDGFVATEQDKMAVFNGLEISIIGGKENPLIISGKPYSDAVVEIKNDLVVVKSETK